MNANWNQITEPARPENGDVCLVTLEGTEKNLTYGNGGGRYTYMALFTNDNGGEKWGDIENYENLENGFWVVTAWTPLPAPFTPKPKEVPQESPNEEAIRRMKEGNFDLYTGRRG